MSVYHNRKVTVRLTFEEFEYLNYRMRFVPEYARAKRTLSNMIRTIIAESKRLEFGQAQPSKASSTSMKGGQ